MDSVGGFVYVVDGGVRQLLRYNLDGSNRTLIYTSVGWEPKWT